MCYAQVCPTCPTYAPYIPSPVDTNPPLCVLSAHLDRIKAAMPAMSASLGLASRVQGSGSGGGGGGRGSMEHVSQVAYTKRRVGEIEEAIRELLEGVAEAKCELLLG